MSSPITGLTLENVLYEKKDSIAYVTLNRPKVLNALNKKTWADLRTAFEAARDDTRRYHQLLELLDLIVGELRKRVGGTYTLEELAGAYSEAEAWARELLDERSTLPGWPRDLTTVLAAAFDAYQLGAVDYAP